LTPTPKLRFVERLVIVSHAQQIAKTVHILQQWWTVTGTEPEFQDHFGEWRDVPTEKENT